MKRRGFLARMDRHLEVANEHMGRMDIRMARMDVHMGRMDVHMGRMDVHMGRMDVHMAQTNAHMAETKEHIAQTKEHIVETKVFIAEARDHMARGNELMVNVTRQLARNEESHQDLRHFIRDITRRSEVVFQGVVAELRDLRAETQAQTAAIYKVLDRLPPAAA